MATLYAITYFNGTFFLTAAGYKKIEEIREGDTVLAYDEETGEQDYKKVVRLFRNTTKEWYHIFANGEEIVCTAEHPFYVANFDKFISAKELKIGNIFLQSDGTHVIIEAIHIKRLAQPETTYNFEVEDFHTYYVTKNNFLVHNDCKYYEATRTEDGIVKGKEITKKQALQRVRNGQDVLAGSRAGAKSLVKNAFGNAKAYHEIHTDISNAMNHFHDANNHFYHVFYK